MMFNVPQYIDVEDKVAGPLTAKQLLWMIGMGAVLLVLWNIFAFGTFAVLAIPVILIFVAFAFYKPYGQPMVVFAGNVLMFLFRPKVYIWHRPYEATPLTQKAPEPAQTEPMKNTEESQKAAVDTLHELSAALDDKVSTQNK